jgi:DnaA family protein
MSSPGEGGRGRRGVTAALCPDTERRHRKMGVQLPLDIRLSDGASFDSYYEGPNQEPVALLKLSLEGRGERILYLWGGSGAGKTHLLQAACRRLSDGGRASGFVPLADRALDPAILEGLHHLPLLCLDDLQACAGRVHWEQALFALYQRAQETGNTLVIAAAAAPAAVGMNLPDLRSRLTASLVLHLSRMDDQTRMKALQHRARWRGLELPDPAARFLLSRCARDPKSLFAVLDRLDAASLAARRKLTVSFLRTVLDSGPS